MEAALSEERMGNLRAKIAACQQEYAALSTKASSSHLTPDAWTAISRLKQETTMQCDYFRYLLDLYEHR
jgi:hypothetical protein